MTRFTNFGSRGGPQGGSSQEPPYYYGSWVFDSKEAEFEPPGLPKIFFSDIQSVTLNYHTPRLKQNNMNYIYISRPPVKGKEDGVELKYNYNYTNYIGDLWADLL